jgi:hypothetical protein
MNYYEKLQKLNEQIQADFSDEGDEGNSPVYVYHPQYVDVNAPWVYVHFEYSGPLSLDALKKIEKRFIDFCAMEGGSYQSLRMSRQGPGFVVKLVYVGP